MVSKSLFIITTTILYFVWHINGDDGPLVTLNNGKVRGIYLTTHKGKQFSGYLGIPYAQPPLGDLRFKNPLPAKPWSNILEATTDPPQCAQVDFLLDSSGLVFGEEDCLFTNVYTPKMDPNDNTQYPVMVWIHGGGWALGSGIKAMYGPEYLLNHDVVLVSFNYRLGPLGFLSTGDEHAPGNFGLKDQQLLLKWVQENIAQFGGNPNLVTLFGESAGGASAQYHMFSKSSRGLFHRAIGQSGSVFNLWAQMYKRDALTIAHHLGKLVGCKDAPSTVKLVECLRKKNARDLAKHNNLLATFDIDPLMAFRPVVEPDLDGAFLTEDPLTLLKRGDVTQVPYILGYNSEEGALRSCIILSKPELTKEINENKMSVFPKTFMYGDTSDNPNAITEKLVKAYFGTRSIDRQTKMDLTHLYSDAVLISGVESYKRLHDHYLKSPLYSYVFGFSGSMSITYILGNRTKESYGVSHMDELFYLFPMANVFFGKDVKLVDQQMEMIDILTTLWTNFAKFGEPTPATEYKLDFSWLPLHSVHNDAVLQIQSPKNIKMDTNYMDKRINFWMDLPYYPQMYAALQKVKKQHEEL